MDFRHEKIELHRQDMVAKMRRRQQPLPDIEPVDTQRIAQKARRTEFWEKFGLSFVRRRPN